MELKAKCKRCQKEVRVDELKLDYIYKMMVCPACIKERQTTQQVRQELKKEGLPTNEPKRPAGWDSEDEYLERVYQERDRSTVKVQKVDSDRVKYNCVNCKYGFVINIITKTPKMCPYCGSPVSRLRL
jgi:DNA-directed RNA polymerase subunit RPC12/RpoP